MFRRLEIFSSCWRDTAQKLLEASYSQFTGLANKCFALFDSVAVYGTCCARQCSFYADVAYWFLTFCRERAEEFCAELEAEEGCPAWVVGTVLQGVRRARIRDTPTILEV
jgi:hypothetical protein